MWKYRDEYFKLFVSFTNFSSSSDEFTDRFLELRAFHVTECNRLIKELEISFEPYTKSNVSDEILESIEDSRTIGEIDESSH